MWREMVSYILLSAIVAVILYSHLHGLPQPHIPWWLVTVATFPYCEEKYRKARRKLIERKAADELKRIERDPDSSG